MQVVLGRLPLARQSGQRRLGDHTTHSGAQGSPRRGWDDGAAEAPQEQLDFFRDLQANLAAAEAPDRQGAQMRAALIRRLIERVEVYPTGSVTCTPLY